MQAQMKISKAARKWMTRLADTVSPWTENDIIYYRKAISQCGLKSAEEKLALHEAFADKGYRITAEQDAKGRNYLLSNSLKKDGTPRKGNVLGDAEIRIMQNLKHHLFVGVYHKGGFYNYYLPVYRAIAKDGSYFEYIGTMYKHVEVLDVVEREIA